MPGINISHDNDDIHAAFCLYSYSMAQKRVLNLVEHLTCIFKLFYAGSGTVLKIKQERFGDPDSKTR